MSFLDRRRAKPSPAQLRAAQEEARRQVALAVSVAEKKARKEAEADLAAILADADITIPDVDA